MNLYGPVRANVKSKTGNAKLTLSFAAWKAGRVASTQHTLVVAKPKPRPKLAPVAANLLTSLPHPKKTAQLWTVRFSKDGHKLFTIGHPSGIVQIWDVAKRQELRRIETSPDLGNMVVFTSPTAEWKTMYVPVQSRKVKVKEKNGKKTYRYIFNGEIRVWDLTTGAKKPAIKMNRDTAPCYLKVSPDGRFLYCVEQNSFDRDETSPSISAILYDTWTGTRRTLARGYCLANFSPDGKTLALSLSDNAKKKSAVRLVDVRSGITLAEAVYPDNDRYIDAGVFSPDRSLIAVSIGGKKGVPAEVRFRDAKTLAARGRYVGSGKPNDYGWCKGQFTSDGKHFILLNRQIGQIVIWDVASQKVVHSRRLPADSDAAWFAVCPDDDTVAVAWWFDTDTRALIDGKDPHDMPQLRVRIWNWRDGTAPRDLVCPPGGVAGLAFSPDGTRLAVAGTGAVHVFDVSK